MQAKEISLLVEIFQKRRRPHKKKGDEIDDFVKVVVTVHPFR